VQGVLAVLTAKEMLDAGIRPIPTRVKRRRPDGSPGLEPPYYPLAVDRVRHAGEAIVAIIADTLAQAKDAAELVEIEFEELPAAAETAFAAEPDAPKVWDEFPDNICFEYRLGEKSEVDRTFAEAAHVVTERLVISRVAASPLEPRAALGSFDRRSGRYSLVAGLQSPHTIRDEIAEVFGLPASQFRVIAPDVGGAFGMKASLHPELVLTLWGSKVVGRPVEFVVERAESFLSDHQSRDNVSDVSLAVDAEGRFLALRVNTIANVGAYVASNGLHSPTNNLGGLAGVYTIPAFDITVRGVFSNTIPTCPFRGAGRPEASYCIELIVDAAARRVGLDRAEIRRINIIRPDQMPYRTNLVYTYDCGEFEAVLDRCLAEARWSEFESRRAEASARGKLRGIGIAYVIEIAGGPNDRPFEEFTELRFDSSGQLTILAGSHSHGQGHATAYRQFAAEYLGVSGDQVSVVYGDTDLVSHGRGTFGSRTMMAAGAAFVRSCEKIIETGRLIAAHILETDSDNIEFKAGLFLVAGTNRSVSIGEVAAASYSLKTMPADMEIGFQAASSVALKDPTFPNGCHICEIEIDPETGGREIIAYHVVDDVGTVINPLLLEGQIMGGIAQGIGQALDEIIIYDGDGQILTGSFQDYAMPRASDLPSIHIVSHPVPTRTNPLGAKGAGEAGTVGALPAAMSAIRDALFQVGVTSFDMPATPSRIWRAITAARRAKGRDDPSKRSEASRG
jgi:carbon-monoxide dehydrogenase large subunit